MRSCTALQVLVTSRCLLGIYACSRPPPLRDGQSRFRRVRVQTPNSVSFFGPHRVLEGELCVFLSPYYLCAIANSPELTEFAGELSEFSSETVLS